MESNKAKSDDDTHSVVNLKLVDPLGKSIAGLRYQVRNGVQIVARGITDAEGKFSSFVSTIGTLLSVHVERFGTTEYKEVKKIIPWSEDFRIKLVSGKRKDKLDAKEDKGAPGEYQRKTYKVRKDDTLGKIAPKFGTTAAALAALNGIRVTDVIHIDQILKVPSKSAPSGQAPANADAKPTSPPAQPVPAAPKAPESSADSKPDSGGATPEPGAAKEKPVTTPVPITKEEGRGENGTPKTTVSPLCDQSGCIKIGDKGQLVEELNLRLMGFGNTIHDPSPLTEFTVATEKAVKKFQRDYMQVAETGKVCGAVLAAMDDFLNKYPIPFDGFACQCRANGAGANEACNGFGKVRHDSASVNHLKNGVNVKGIEKPGIHRALFWSLRAALFYLRSKEGQLGYEFWYVSSGYRCWKRAKQMHIWTTNHLGNACDVHFKRKSNGSHVTGDALESLKNKVFVDRVGARPRWDKVNHISLEPQSITDKWVHMDIREFNDHYLLDRYYAKTKDAADGDPLMTMARREGRLGLVNCGGITPPTAPAVAPVSGPTPQKPASPPAPKVPAKREPKPAPKPPQGNGGKHAPVTAGPASTGRKDPDTLHVSQLGLDFIRVWESGSLTKNHLEPYNDSKGYCTIGVGHLIDGKRSCADLSSSGSAAYQKYAKGISKEEESELFADDVERIRNRTLSQLQVPLHQYEFDALMSLAFNTGGLKKFPKLLAKLNTGNYGGCCDEFADITNGGELASRRQSEMKLFRNNVYDANH